MWCLQWDTLNLETELRNGDAQVPAQIKITEGPVLNLHKFVPSEVKINSLPY